jgi:histone H3/H4
MTSSRLLPLAAMDKAKVALKNTMEDLADEIAAKAVNLAKHAGRVTVKASDIKLAAKS